jgi:hypothetical protein
MRPFSVTTKGAALSISDWSCDDRTFAGAAGELHEEAVIAAMNAPVTASPGM